jgi:lysophospholipase L1-like esterase
MTYGYTLLLGAGLMVLLTSGSAKAQGVKDDPIIGRSLVSMGDTARVQAVLAKARRGEKVVVGVLGGSITQGASASKEEFRYGNRIAQWWGEKFPKTEIEFVNAGIGATGSDIGAHRVKAHLLDKQPDFVVVEYAVNDGIVPGCGETLEGVVRQILKQPNSPAVMLLFMMDKSGTNKQEEHEVIGKHYGLPMVSFRDSLWPEIKEERIAWSDVEADEVHPNDRGHEYAARFVTNVLEKVIKTMPSDTELAANPPVPAPRISDVYERTTMYNAENLTPASNAGWETYKDPGFSGFYGKSWRSDKPGSAMEFDVEGTAISVLFYRVRGGTGIAEASVDDKPPVRMDAWFEATWGGYSPLQLVARDLTPGKHRLRIKLLDDKNPGSTGNEFRVFGVFCAGR